MTTRSSRHLPLPGGRYRVKQTCKSGPTTFTAVEVLVFVRDTYSHYDNALDSVY